MFLTSKTIDIFHTQTIDVPTLEAGMGVVRLRGCLYTPIHSYALICLDAPHMSECAPHICMPPCSHVHLCMGIKAFIYPILIAWMMIC